MKIENEIAQKEFRNNYQKAVINIIFTGNRVMESQINILKPYGLTLQQFNILRILRGQHPNPANIKLIKERMLDKMSDASRLVEKLRLKGLVERNICPADRRNVDVMITDKGLELLAQVDKHEAQMDAFMENLSASEIIVLNDLLDKLRSGSEAKE
ncbi:MAG: MarR family winged helix-turn-helix transcriptional regulator [Methanococcaceae archaeon]